MGYFGELRANWRPMLAALIGMSCGQGALTFLLSIMAPHLLESFGWTKAQFAIVGTLGITSLAALPLVGRAVDMFGTKRTAMIGVLALPLVFIAMSMQNGDFRVFMMLVLLQSTICMGTASPVFSRTVIQYIKRTRGLALAIIASGPAVTAFVGGPLMNDLIAAQGWRVGYLAAGAFALIGGMTAVLILPNDMPSKQSIRTKTARKDYGRIFSTPVFWVLVAGILLSNTQNFIINSQMNLLLIDNGVTQAGLSGMIQAMSIGIIIGRFACGLALDRFPAHIVAAISLALPAFGLLIMASSVDTTLALMASVLFLALSYGAEGDLIAFLVARHFGVAVYGSVMGMLVASIATGATLGALFMSVTLKATGSYDTFLVGCSVFVLIGALLFFLLPRVRSYPKEEEAAAATT